MTIRCFLIAACFPAFAFAAAPAVELVDGINLEFPGMQGVRAAAKSGDLRKIQEAYLLFRRSGSRAVWNVMASEMPRNAEAESDASGDEICRHYIRNGYNFEPRGADMGKDFDWTYNPVAKNDPAFTDEWTWCAISRTQFWKTLANAYWRTRNEKYALEWTSQLEDFATKNPLGEAGKDGRVSLWRTLDSSERMFDSWPYAYYHFLNSPAFDGRAQWVYLAMMYDHARLLMDGLSHSKRTGNWVASECFGLYTIGTLFPELRDAPVWRQAALDRIRVEMDRMVPADGFEAELTPNYHMVSLRGFLGPLKLAKLNGAPLPSGLEEHIRSMYRALVKVMDQSGYVVATNDSGPLNAAAVAAMGLRLGPDPLLEWAASGRTRGDGLPDSTALPYAGFYALRGGWRPDDLFLFFRAGPTGIGHEHEDMLQIVLRAWGRTLLFEPGSYNYDHSDWRRYTIGTASHNTVIIDGRWQHRGPNHVPVSKAAENPFVTTPLFDYVAGTYDGGYQQSVYNPKRQYQPQDWVGDVDRSVTHTRRVLFLRPRTVLVLDTLDGSGEHTFDAHFHLESPAARVDTSSGAVFSQNEGDVQLALYPLDREHLEVDVVQGQKEPLLGWFPHEHRAIPTVRFRKRQAAPATFATLLCPFKGAAPALHADHVTVRPDGVWQVRLTIDGQDTDVALALDGTLHRLGGDAQVEASGLVVRRTSPSEVQRGAWGLQSYRDPNVALTLDAKGDILVRTDSRGTTILNAGEHIVTATLTRPQKKSLDLVPGRWIDIH